MSKIYNKDLELIGILDKIRNNLIDLNNTDELMDQLYLNTDMNF